MLCQGYFNIMLQHLEFKTFSFLIIIIILFTNILSRNIAITYVILLFFQHYGTIFKIYIILYPYDNIILMLFNDVIS